MPFLFPQLPSCTIHSHLTALVHCSSGCSSLHDCANVLVNRSANKSYWEKIYWFFFEVESVSQAKPTADTREFVMCYSTELGGGSGLRWSSHVEWWCGGGSHTATTHGGPTNNADLLLSCQRGVLEGVPRQPKVIWVLEDTFLHSHPSVLTHSHCWGLCWAISACYTSWLFLSGQHWTNCQRSARREAEMCSWGWGGESGIMAVVRSALVPLNQSLSPSLKRERCSSLSHRNFSHPLR